MSSIAEKKIKQLMGMEIKAGRPSKMELEKRAKGTASLTKLQNAFRGRLARKELAKRADRVAEQIVLREPATTIQNAIRGRLARKKVEKLADKKILQLEDDLHNATVATIKANIASLDRQIAMVGKSKLAIRKGVLADRIERPIIWGKMIIEIPNHMYYRKTENFTQKLDEQIINNGRIMSLKGIPSIIIRTADIQAPRIVNDGSIDSIEREKELNKEVKKYEGKGKEIIKKLDDRVQQYEEKGAQIVNAKSNAAKTILDAYRAKKAREEMAKLKPMQVKPIATPVMRKLVKILAQKKRIGR